MREEPCWLAEEIERFPMEVVELPDVLQDVAAGIRRWSVHVTHPRYFGHYNPSVAAASVFRDAPALRACITSNRTQPADVAVLIDELERALAD